MQSWSFILLYLRTYCFSIRSGGSYSCITRARLGSWNLGTQMARSSLDSLYMPSGLEIHSLSCLWVCLHCPLCISPELCLILDPVFVHRFGFGWLSKNKENYLRLLPSLLPDNNKERNRLVLCLNSNNCIKELFLTLKYDAERQDSTWVHKFLQYQLDHGAVIWIQCISFSLSVMCLQAW